MLTEKDYCDKDTAFALQELGYNPYMFYDDGTPAIHLWYAQKFLREEWGIHITIHYMYHLNEHVFGVTLRFMGKTLRDSGALYDTTKYSTYEEALSEGLRAAVKILKENETIHR